MSMYLELIEHWVNSSFHGTVMVFVLNVVKLQISSLLRLRNSDQIAVDFFDSTSELYGVDFEDDSIPPDDDPEDAGAHPYDKGARYS